MFQQLDGTPYAVSQPVANFLSGGLASNLYWITALRESAPVFCGLLARNGPADTLEKTAWDNVKNRIMADRLASPVYPNARAAFRAILHENDLPSRSRVGNWLASGRNFYRVRRDFSGVLDAAANRCYGIRASFRFSCVRRRRMRLR